MANLDLSSFKRKTTAQLNEEATGVFIIKGTRSRQLSADDREKLDRYKSNLKSAEMDLRGANTPKQKEDGKKRVELWKGKIKNLQGSKGDGGKATKDDSDKLARFKKLLKDAESDLSNADTDKEKESAQNRVDNLKNTIKELNK